MTIIEVKKYINKKIENKNEESKRLFHGRGNAFTNFEFLCLDSFDKLLFVTFYKEIESSLEEELFDFVEDIYEKNDYETVILQRRYLKNAPSQLLFGKLNKEYLAIENKIKYKLELFKNQNIAFFLDMRKGREFVFNMAYEKKVLNLFSYTCAFSVVAIKAGAYSVLNLDMSKASLSLGRINHHINELETKKVNFMPHNILKSWNKIKKNGPYDLIIIDPPSFQKGSFAASLDYEKIIKRLKDFASNNCVVLSCLNAPELDTNFIKNLFSKLAPEFKYIKRLENMEDFPCINEEKSLKNLIFKRDFSSL